MYVCVCVRACICVCVREINIILSGNVKKTYLSFLSSTWCAMFYGTARYRLICTNSACTSKLGISSNLSLYISKKGWSKSSKFMQTRYIYIPNASKAFVSTNVLCTFDYLLLTTNNKPFLLSNGHSDPQLAYQGAVWCAVYGVQTLIYSGAVISWL